MIRSRISILLASGRADHKHAAIPAMIGHAKLVPLPNTTLLSIGLINAVPFPTAQTSGFTLPSAVGPHDENLAISLVRTSIAPTVNMLSASAGEVI